MPEHVCLDFDPEREEAELREYLGRAYDRDRLIHNQEVVDAEFQRCGNEDRFYRSSEGYLYNLTAFAMTGTKLPYLAELIRHLPAGARVLDYGCGIGSDGLHLLEHGFRVEFADFRNPSTDYLRWRLRRRDREAPLHDLDEHVPGGFDGVFAFDVIEHVPDPGALLSELERRAGLVEVNLLEPVPGDQELHHELPIWGLLGRAARGEVVSYRVLHHRSHLLVYRPGNPGAKPRLPSVARLALGQARHRAGRRLRR